MIEYVFDCLEEKSLISMLFAFVVHPEDVPQPSQAPSPNPVDDVEGVDADVGLVLPRSVGEVGQHHGVSAI